MRGDEGGSLFVMWMLGVVCGFLLFEVLTLSGAGGWKQHPKIERCANVVLNASGQAKQEGYQFKIYTGHVGDLCVKIPR